MESAPPYAYKRLQIRYQAQRRAGLDDCIYAPGVACEALVMLMEELFS